MHEATSRVLADLSPERRTSFRLRLDRWYDDLLGGLAGIYPDPEALAGRLAVAAAGGFRDRPEELHEVDERRLLEPDWLQHPRMFGYACYAGFRR